MRHQLKNKLLEQLAHYGYPLLEPAPLDKPEEVLKNLLRQDDLRLLEGFPVVFAHALRDRDPLEWEKPKWRPLDKLSQKAAMRLAYLLALSYLLFQLFGVGEDYEDRTLKLLSKFKSGSLFLKQLRGPFLRSLPLKMDRLELSVDRLKNNFRNYFFLAPESEELQKKKRSLELELLLSELFTSRQKELLRKRLEGKPFTKTEREYYYRVVKKRLRALADEELHQMARQVLRG